MDRDLATRPVSPERKTIQQIGKLEMDAATRWLRHRLMQERISLGLPTCSAICGPVPKLAGETFECALEPGHHHDHESVDHAIWSPSLPAAEAVTYDGFGAPIVRAAEGQVDHG
jgi:hypothetical protein